MSREAIVSESTVPTLIRKNACFRIALDKSNAATSPHVNPDDEISGH